MSISRIELYTCYPEDVLGRVGFTLTLPRNRLRGNFISELVESCTMMLPRRNLEMPQFARGGYVAPSGKAALNRNHPLANRLTFHLGPGLEEGYVTGAGDTSVVPLGAALRRMGLVGPALDHSLIDLPLERGSRLDAAFSFFVYFSYRQSPTLPNTGAQQFADFFRNRLNIDIVVTPLDSGDQSYIRFKSRGFSDAIDVAIEPVGVSRNWFKVGASFKVVEGHLTIQLFNSGRLLQTISRPSSLTNDESLSSLSLRPGNFVDVGAFYLWKDRILTTAEHRQLASNPFALVAPGR